MEVLWKCSGVQYRTFKCGAVQCIWVDATNFTNKRRRSSIHAISGDPVFKSNNFIQPTLISQDRSRFLEALSVIQIILSGLDILSDRFLPWGFFLR
jgi:hypothetical protein